MSADIQIRSTSSEQEFPYRALSTTAIASVICAAVSLLGLFVWAFLGLAFLGMFLGFVGPVPAIILPKTSGFRLSGWPAI